MPDGKLISDPEEGVTSEEVLLTMASSVPADPAAEPEVCTDTLKLLDERVLVKLSSDPSDPDDVNTAEDDARAIHNPNMYQVSSDTPSEHDPISDSNCK